MPPTEDGCHWTCPLCEPRCIHCRDLCTWECARCRRPVCRDCSAPHATLRCKRKHPDVCPPGFWPWLLHAATDHALVQHGPGGEWRGTLQKTAHGKGRRSASLDEPWATQVATLTDAFIDKETKAIRGWSENNGSLILWTQQPNEAAGQTHVALIAPPYPPPGDRIDVTALTTVLLIQ